MSKLKLVLAPNSIYSKQSVRIDVIDDEIIHLAEEMVKFTLENQAYGVAAPMFGISKQIIVVHVQEEPLVMINPVILEVSDEKETMYEESLSFIGIGVEVPRPKLIKLEYMDLQGKLHQIERDGIFGRAIQHECDYLIGKNILSYVSKLKFDMLTAKMLKYIKLGHIPHVHTSSCNH